MKAQWRLNEVKNALHFGGWEDVVINQAHFSQTTFEIEIRPAEEKVAEEKA